jgi:GGDEF domain-containing protein
MRGLVEDNFLARLGGDKFSIVIASPVTPERTLQIADELLAAVSQVFEFEGHQLRAGLSIGTAIFPNDGADAATLLGHTDAALYRD